MNSPTDKTEIIPNCDPAWDYAEIYSEYCLMQSSLNKMLVILKNKQAEEGNSETDFDICTVATAIKQQSEEILKCLSEYKDFQPPTERFLERNCGQNGLIILGLEQLSEQLTQVNISLLTIKENLALLAIPTQNEQQQM